MKKIQRTIVSALILSSDKKLFLGKKASGGGYDDCWHIPGGGVEGDEDKLVALEREIWEETGLDITQHQVVLADDQGSGVTQKTKNGETMEVTMKFFVYKIELEQPAAEVKVSLNDDLIEYTWAPLEKLSEYQHTPPSIALFKRLGWL